MSNEHVHPAFRAALDAMAPPPCGPECGTEYDCPHEPPPDPPALPATIELCQRIREGMRCLGRIHRSGDPEVVCCTACGSKRGGADYTPIEVLRELFLAGDALAQELQEDEPGLVDLIKRFNGALDAAEVVVQQPRSKRAKESAENPDLPF
jgi:hypothetical protein